MPVFPHLPLALSFLLVGASAVAHARESTASVPKLGSTVFKWEELVAKPTGVGERRDVARTATATLTEFECHSSTLNPGLPSHPPHSHAQEELIILTDGTLEVFINGTTQRIGPGSPFFFAAYDLHSVRNVGEVPAKYHVFNFLTAKTAAIPEKPAAEVATTGQLQSGVYEWKNLPVEKTQVGFRREVLDAPTVTCERLRCHVTTLNPGLASHAPHRHPDEEVMVVKEGALDVTINGVTQRASTGSVIFFGSNDEHGVKNAGDIPVTYYVIRVVSEATPKPTTL